MKTFNKGEWTELYVICRLARSNVVPIADSKLRPVPNKFIRVLRIFMRDKHGMDSSYDVSTPGQISSTSIGSYGSNTVLMPESRVSLLRENIISGIGSSFSIPDGELIMDELSINDFKASSYCKADLKTETFLPQINDVKKVNYSIKSQLGGLPTLLNASRATNFVYRIDGFHGNEDEINSVGSVHKVYDRIMRIKQCGGTLSYCGMENNTFCKNLRKIDSLLPNILAELMIIKYSNLRINRINDLCNRVPATDLFEYDQSDIAEKIKKLLLSVALGMVPTVDWREDDTDGFIVVRQDGNLLGYTLYETSDLKNYLYENTKLDTPSTSRHHFGKIYRKDNTLYIKLNLDIRFC